MAKGHLLPCEVPFFFFFLSVKLLISALFFPVKIEFNSHDEE